MPDVLMKCGCRAQGYTGKAGDRKPICIIHDCTEVADEQPDLTGRKARCSYYGCGVKYGNRKDGKCHSEVDSSIGLPFFEYRPDAEYDKYYCGCWGWD